MAEKPDWFELGEKRRKLRQEIISQGGESSLTLKKKKAADQVIESEELQERITAGELDALSPDATIIDANTAGNLKALEALDERAQSFTFKDERGKYAEARRNARTEATEEREQSESSDVKEKLFSELDNIEVFLNRLKRAEYESLRHSHPGLANKLREGAKLEQTVQARLERIKADPVLSVWEREHELKRYRQQYEGGRFVVTESRKVYIDRIQSLIEQGKPILLEGHTGTGKSELARIAAEQLTGANPEVIYCNPQTRQSDVFGKQTLKSREGATVTEVDFGPLVRAMRDGKLCLFDEFNELDPRQRQVLKYLFNAKPGDEVDIPGDGKIMIQPGFGLIMTANLKSEKYSAKSELEPQEARVFQDSTIRIEYMPDTELYDLALTTLADTEGKLLLTTEEAEVTLKHFVDAVHDIQTAYTDSIPAAYGKDDQLSMGGRGANRNKRPSLEKYVIDSGMAARLLTGFRTSRMKYGTPLQDFLNRALARTFEGDRVSEGDKKLAIFMLAKHGFLQAPETLQALKLDYSDGRLNPSIFPALEHKALEEAETLTPLSVEEAALLDPYNERQLTVTHAAAEFDHVVDPEVRARLSERGERGTEQGKVSYEEAENIMGSDLFCGPKTIEALFGNFPGEMPPILFSRAELERAKALGQHLVLYTETLADGTRLTVDKLEDLLDNKTSQGEKYLYDSQWYREDSVTSQEAPRTEWRLTGNNPFEGSQGKSYLDQTASIFDYLRDEVYAGRPLPQDYEHALMEFEHKKDDWRANIENDWERVAQELAEASINQLCRERFVEALYRLALVEKTAGDKGLDPAKTEISYTWTNSRGSGGYLVRVGDWGARGLRVNGWRPRDSYSNIGVCFSRSHAS